MIKFQVLHTRQIQAKFMILNRLQTWSLQTHLPPPPPPLFPQDPISLTNFSLILGMIGSWTQVDYKLWQKTVNIPGVVTVILVCSGLALASLWSVRFVELYMSDSQVREKHLLQVPSPSCSLPVVFRTRHWKTIDRQPGRPLNDLREEIALPTRTIQIKASGLSFRVFGDKIL